jgi:hypothetical protein
MTANDVRSNDAVRFGAYLCLSALPGARQAMARAAVPALADRLSLRNEFEPGDDHPPEAIAFLRRVDAVSADLPDDGLERCDAVVHVASPTAERVAEFRVAFARLLGPDVTVRVLAGVVRPTSFTGNLMHNSPMHTAHCRRRARRCPKHSCCR